MSINFLMMIGNIMTFKTLLLWDNIPFKNNIESKWKTNTFMSS